MEEQLDWLLGPSGGAVGTATGDAAARSARRRELQRRGRRSDRSCVARVRMK
jgi:hypothetical protein